MTMTGKIFRSIIAVATAVLVACFAIIFAVLYDYLGDRLAAELEQRVKIVEMLNKDGLIAGLEERLDRLKKEDNAHEKQSAA